MSKALEALKVEDDGMICPEVGGWAEEKYRLISLYDSLFAQGMKNKWDQRVYIDLYAGSGHSLLRGTGIRVAGSPILALKVPTPFDRYIFCEEDPDLMAALKARAERVAPGADITYISGRCDQHVDSIRRAIPRYSPTNRTLSLCFVDPYDFGLKFETIRSLSEFYIDFMVLLAVGMDANRAYEHYVDGPNQKLDVALGTVVWKERWKEHPRNRDEFLVFIAQEFANSMHSLEYLKIGPAEMKLVRNEKNVPLYYLALFSKNKTAYRFWEQVLKYGTDQIGFNWEG